MALLGLRCCTRAFSSCGEWGLLFVVVCGLLIAVASCCGARALGAWGSVAVARRLSSYGSRALERRLSSCGARAYLLRGMCDIPGPGIEPMSPALAGGFLTTVPPGKSPVCLFVGTQFNPNSGQSLGRAWSSGPELSTVCCLITHNLCTHFPRVSHWSGHLLGTLPPRDSLLPRPPV